MNSEVFANIIFKVLIALGSGVAGAAGISASCQQAVAAPLSVGLAGGLVALVSGIWGVYQHWGMKKVPVDAVIATPTMAGMGSTVGPAGGLTGNPAMDRLKAASERQGQSKS